MPKRNFCTKREKIVGMIIIKNGTIIDPVSERLYRADLEIKEGRIDKITVQEETAGLQHEGETEEIAAKERQFLEDVQVIDRQGQVSFAGHPTQSSCSQPWLASRSPP